MLRYGDGTPFPYVENVLAILEDAVSACAAMFEAASELDHQREDARAARRVVDEEARRLRALEQSVANATAEARNVSDPDAAVSRRAAQRAVAAIQRAIREGEAELDQIAAVKAAEPAWEPLAQKVHAAAARFFEQQSLPNTCWTWAWTAEGVRASAVAHGHATPFQLAFDLDVAPVWRAPVRCGVLAAGIVLQLPTRRMFGSPAVAATKLDPMFLVHAAVDANGRSMVIRERATPSTGWRIQIPAQGAARCHLIDREGRIDGPEFELATDEALQKLWTAIEAEVTTMHRNRHARELLLNGQALTTVADITGTARAILDVLAPIVRAIRAHSRGAGELVLKRDVADGVRAELYISHEAIVARYAELPPAYKRFFDDAGFGRGHTEPADGVALLQAPRFARASQPQLPPQPPPPPPQQQPQPAQQAQPAQPAQPPPRRSVPRLDSC